MTKIYTKADIANLLMNNDKAVARALVALNNRQTPQEQSAQTTIMSNGRGFTSADARIGTSMAEFYTKFGRLSEKQIQYWRKPNAKGTPRIVKYTGQLAEVANGNA